MHRNAIFLVKINLQNIFRIFFFFCLGNGTNPNLHVGEEYTITVDTHEAGPGAVTCRIRSTLGNDLDIDIVDNEDGTFNLFYTPHNPGNYVIKIKFGGQDIPGGDFVVTVSFSKRILLSLFLLT
jgi:hypothetical protein